MRSTRAHSRYEEDIKSPVVIAETEGMLRTPRPRTVSETEQEETEQKQETERRPDCGLRVKSMYKYYKELGKGAYGAVHAACDKDNNCQYAVKEAVIRTEQDQVSFLREVFFLRLLAPTGLAPRLYYTEYCTYPLEKPPVTETDPTHNDIGFVVLEKLGPSLRDVFRSRSRDFEKYLPATMCGQLIYAEELLQITRLAIALGNLDVVHGDLKLHNIVFRDQTHKDMVWIDFGFSGQVSSTGAVNVHVQDKVFTLEDVKPLNGWLINIADGNWEINVGKIKREKAVAAQINLFHLETLLIYYPTIVLSHKNKRPYLFRGFGKLISPLVLSDLMRQGRLSAEFYSKQLTATRSALKIIGVGDYHVDSGPGNLLTGFSSPNFKEKPWEVDLQYVNPVAKS